MFIGKVIDEAMGIDGNVNTMDSDGGVGEIIQLGGSNGHGREDFLYDKGGHGVYW